MPREVQPVARSTIPEHVAEIVAIPGNQKIVLRQVECDRVEILSEGDDVELQAKIRVLNVIGKRQVVHQQRGA